MSAESIYWGVRISNIGIYLMIRIPEILYVFFPNNTVRPSMLCQYSTA